MAGGEEEATYWRIDNTTTIQVQVVAGSVL